MKAGGMKEIRRRAVKCGLQKRTALQPKADKAEAITP